MQSAGCPPTLKEKTIMARTGTVHLAWIALVTLGVAMPHAALAWGAAGHRIVGELGAQNFSAELPGFLRAPGVAADIGEWAREPDRSKGAGKIHDSARDPAHFVDVDDSGKVLGGPPLAALPPTRLDYDTALRAVGSNSYKSGYLPYSIIDGWQQLVKDFTYWRILHAALAHTDSADRKAYYARDIARREKQTVMDLGIWAHFVGDGSQPLHVTVHRDGWGDYPNPNGYTKDRLHTPFEGDFVHAHVTETIVRPLLPPPAPDCACGIEAWTAHYLIDTAKYSQTVYAMYAAGDFSHSNPQGEAFAAGRIAVGAAQLRDMTLAAWRTSDEGRIGNPATLLVSVQDAESGKVDPYDALVGMD
jgi:hypothetical protein